MGVRRYLRRHGGCGDRGSCGNRRDDRHGDAVVVHLRVDKDIMADRAGPCPADIFFKIGNLAASFVLLVFLILSVVE